MEDRIAELEEEVAELKFTLSEWRLAFNRRVFMKVEEEHHKQWFLDLLDETRRLLEDL